MDPLSSRRLGPVWRPGVAGKYNRRIAVIGMFFGEVALDVEHQLFCGADSVHVGACEVQTVFAALSWCHVANLEAKMSKSDPSGNMPLERWTGVIVAFHTCDLVRSTRQCLERARSNSVSALSTLRLMKANDKMSVRIPWPRWVATRSPRKRCLPV